MALACAMGTAAAQCPEAPWKCPSAGTVHVAEFDFAEPKGLLDRDEIQCAVDCIDGTRDEEWSLRRGPKDVRPPRLPGGELVFRADLRHELAGSVKLPFWTDGALVLRGNGATIDVPPTGTEAAFERVAPPGANGCDVEAMVSGAAHWRIEDFKFLARPPKGSRASPRRGIVLHGTGMLAVRNCWFSTFDVALDLRFALFALVEDCTFAGSARHDVVLGGRKECLAESGLRDCWLPCDGTTRGLFTTGTRRVTGSGCHASTLRRTRHLAPVLPIRQLAGVELLDSHAVLIEGSIFEGGRADAAIRRRGDPTQAKLMTMRNLYFEPGAQDPDDPLDGVKNPLILDQGCGRVLVDGITVIAARDTLVFEAGETCGLSVTFRHAAPFGRNLVMKASRADQDFRFSDVDHGSGTSSLLHPGRWLDARGQPGKIPQGQPGSTVPARVIVDDAIETVLPVVGGYPPNLDAGQLWFNPAYGRLQYCCDTEGRSLFLEAGPRP